MNINEDNFSVEITVDNQDASGYSSGKLLLDVFVVVYSLFIYQKITILIFINFLN